MSNFLKRGLDIVQCIFQMCFRLRTQSTDIKKNTFLEKTKKNREIR